MGYDFLEQWRKEGLRVHIGKYVIEGDLVQSIRNVQSEIPKGTITEVVGLSITPPGNGKGNAVKRLILKGFEGEYNPQRFVKIEKDTEISPNIF